MGSASVKIDSSVLVGFYHTVMRCASSFGSATVKGLKEEGISVSLDSYSGDGLKIESSFPHSEEVARAVWGMLGGNGDYSSCNIDGRFFRLSPKVIDSDMLFHVLAEEYYDNKSGKGSTTVTVGDVLFDVLPHDNEKWSTANRLDSAFSTALEGILGKIEYDSCYIHLYDNNGTPAVEYCTEADFYSGKMNRDEYIKKVTSESLITSLVSVILDRYNFPIKEVYFIGNLVDGFSASRVVAKENSDGEYSLVIY